jgi:D-serine deaminase-like pyridoxal phosphate-dependent protein
LDAEARTAQSSSLVLQTLRARDQDGRFRTRGRYSATTVTGAGTVWDTIDRCDGTLTVVHRGTVIVSDLGLGTTIALHAGQRYLAKAP